MGATLPPAALARTASPFDLDDHRTYADWRAWKLATAARDIADLIVEVDDPYRLTAAESDALQQRLARTNMVVYRLARPTADAVATRTLGAQLGLHRLDANWLAEEDGLSHIAVSDRSDERDGGRGGFIPYTDRPIRWHTDGYYHPDARRIRGMILHCVRPAAEGGVNALLDHELAYIALRDRSPALVRALMQPDAMTIPAREDAGGVARAEQTGPVFSVDAHDGTLHMRYTARTRSIAWKGDADTRAAVEALESLLADSPWVLRTALAAGMGLVCQNVLHDRSGFRDAPDHPRLLYRARYLDRAATGPSDSWRTG